MQRWLQWNNVMTIYSKFMKVLGVDAYDLEQSFKKCIWTWTLSGCSFECEMWLCILKYVK